MLIFLDILDLMEKDSRKPWFFYCEKCGTTESRPLDMSLTKAQQTRCIREDSKES